MPLHVAHAVMMLVPRQTVHVSLNKVSKPVPLHARQRSPLVPLHAGEPAPEPPAFRKPPKPKAIAVSIREAAEMVGVCSMTLKREIDRGHLRGLKVGRMWRVRVAELESYLKRSEERQARK